MAVVYEGGVLTKVSKARKAPKSAAADAAPAKSKKTTKAVEPEPQPAPGPQATAPAIERPAPTKPTKRGKRAPTTDASQSESKAPANSRQGPQSFNAELSAVAAHAQSLAALCEAFVGKLRGDGKAESTVSAYRGELNLALAHFGADTRVENLTQQAVLGFFTSKRVTKLRSGRAKSPLSIAKSQRVLRQCLEWAHAQGWLKESIVPELPAAS